MATHSVLDGQKQFSHRIVAASLVDVLRDRAQAHPDRLAFSYLVDGESKEDRLTFGEVHRQAQSVAALLQNYCAPGELALLLFPPGIEFIPAFLGCLYAGVIAVPAYSPHPVRPQQALRRIRGIACDAQPTVALTTLERLQPTQVLLAGSPETRDIECVATDASDDPAGHWRPPNVRGKSTAFLQYTSGSTAAPRGVAVSHENLMHNEAMIQRAFGSDEGITAVSWLPLYHDMGLIGNVLQPIYIGCSCILMPPVLFLQRPYRWLHTISQHRRVSAGGPNFAYDLCVRRTTLQQRESLDLSNWSVAYNGSEPVHFDTLERFADAFKDCGFRREAFFPCYGLAESTLFVTGCDRSKRPVIRAVDATMLRNHRVVNVPHDQSGAVQLVSSGRTRMDQKVVIVHPNTSRQCRADQVGEIWISGPSVAQGYWNRLGHTEQVFRSHLVDSGEGPFLRTGDLGFVQDGELFVTGRLKDLIIIGGRNHYPQDLERTAEQSHLAVRPGGCVAFSVEGENEEKLVIVAELVPQLLPGRRTQSQVASFPRGANGESVDPQAVIRALNHAVSQQHDVPVYRTALIRAGGIPKTSSGKTERHACRQLYLDGGWELIATND